MQSLSPPAQILSTDIPLNKITAENLQAMRDAFPGADDLSLARFLLARNNKLKDAKTLFSESLKLRLELRLPIRKQDCMKSLIEKKVLSRGFDKEGRPLMIYHSYLHKPKERDMEDAMRMVIFWMEHTISRLPSDKSKFTVLLDRIGSGRDNADFDLTKRTSKLIQTMYPERLHRCIIYPVDMVFYSLWSIGKWLIDPVTREKVTPVMLFSGVTEYIDPQHIPARMGGTDTYEFNVDDFPDPPPTDVAAVIEVNGKEPATDTTSADTAVGTSAADITTSADATAVGTSAAADTVEGTVFRMPAVEAALTAAELEEASTATAEKAPA